MPLSFDITSHLGLDNKITLHSTGNVNTSAYQNCQFVNPRSPGISQTGRQIIDTKDILMYELLGYLSHPKSDQPLVVVFFPPSDTHTIIIFPLYTILWKVWMTGVLSFGGTSVIDTSLYDVSILRAALRP